MTAQELRIASLLSSATEMLYGLGVGDQVVAVSHECDYPAEIAKKPRVTRSHVVSSATSQAIDDQVRQLLADGQPLYEIDEDLLLSLEPDVIVTQAQCDVCAVRYQDVLDFVARESALQSTRVVSLNPMSLADVLQDIVRVGDAIGRADEGRAWVARLKERIAAAKAKTAGLSADKRPRVACIEWIEPLMCAGNWMPELIELAGGQQSFCQPGVHSGYTPWNDLIAFDPQVIVVMPCGFDLARTVQEAERLRSFPVWDNLAAVKEQRVYAVDGNTYFNRSGPRLVDSLEILARLIHPQLFGLRGDETGELKIWQKL